MLSTNNILLLAYYTGEYECAKNQRVVLTNKDKTVDLGCGTGNPVLFRDINGNNFILYSKFVHHAGIRDRVMKWMYCDLFVNKILNAETLELSKPERISISKNNLLGRCQPVNYNGKTVLPLYDELNGTCVLYAGSDLQYNECLRYGFNEIQPAIWCSGDELRSLSRNFRSDRLFSQFSQISFLGSCYPCVASFPSTVPNNNSSLAVLAANNAIFYVFNNTTNRNRINLSLGIYHNNQFCSFLELDSYGSYPFAIEHNGGIAISYTTFYKKIAVKWFKSDELLYRYQYSADRRCISTSPESELL